MPVPYSDNLYSALEDDDDSDYAQSSGQVAASATGPASESNTNANVNTQDAGETDQHDEDEILSPSDGYFHASDAVAYEPTANRQSSNVPFVPNVLVEDPTLHDDDRDTKTREAEHERRLSTMAALQQQASPPFAQQSPIASSSHPRHSHRRSVEEGEDPEDIYNDTEESARSPLLAQTQQQEEPRPGPSETSPLFQQQHFDAPPAYTPSPTARSQPSQQDQSPSSPISSSSNSAVYQTFGSPPASAGASMGVPSEHSRLLPPNREPESMGGESGDHGPRTIGQRIRRAFTPTNGRRKLTKILKWLMVAFIIIGVLSIFSGLTISSDHNPSDHIKDPDDPTPPPSDGTGPEPDEPKEPKPDPPANPDDPQKPSRPPVKDPEDRQDELLWKPRKYCRQPDHDFRFQMVYGIDFGNSRSLSIFQKMFSDHENPAPLRRPNVEGEVILRRSRDSQPHGSLKCEIVGNQKFVETNVHFDEEFQELHVETPDKVEWSYSSGPCIQMRVTVYAPAGSTLENLLVNATQLNIDIVEGLDLSVEQQTILRTISGDINAPAQKASNEDDTKDPYVISTRKTVVETVSGDVNGWFALNDLLKVSSVSGDIALDIAPQAVDPDVPARAELKLMTVSGNIRATEPIQTGLTDDVGTSKGKFPGRDYYTDIATTSGKITAEVAFSSYVNVRSQSGNLDLTLWPVLDPSDSSQPQLGTNTKSGDTKMLLLEPWWTGIIKPQDQRLEEPHDDDDKKQKKPKDGDEPWLIIHPHDAIASDTFPADNLAKTKRSGDDKRALGNLISKHGTISGNVRLQYPSSWEGSLLAETLSGTQRIRGKGLDVYNVSNPLMKTQTGRKGNGSSDMKIMSVSGDEDILVGRE